MWARVSFDGFPQSEIRNPKFRVDFGAGWSSPVARWAHNPKVAGSNPAPATNLRDCGMQTVDCGFKSAIRSPQSEIVYRGCSSVGRAPRLQRGGQGFESPHLHHAIDDLRLLVADLKVVVT
jgi:hypothetical protein